MTNHQLSKIQRWVNGDFASGTPGQQRWTDLPPDQRHNFAALQPTVGGGFHPGMVLTYLMQEPTFFAGAFRFAAGTIPGSIAAYMSIPWQGDFWSCNTTFWPAARPDISVWKDDSQQPPLLTPEPWFHGSTIPPHADSISNYNNGYQTMARDWPLYGFVVPKSGVFDQGQQVFEEIESDLSLFAPTILATATTQKTKTGNALAASSGTVISQPENPVAEAQHWSLIPSTISPNFFLISSNIEEHKVLTVTGSTVSLELRATPHEDSQLWQYIPSGYPGVFHLQSRFNNQVLSVAGETVETAPQGTDSLVQFFRLEKGKQ